MQQKQHRQLVSLQGHKAKADCISQRVLMENLELFEHKPKLIRDRVLLALDLLPGKLS